MRSRDTETKKQVIMRLTESINKTSNKCDLSDSFVKWEDEKNADEIINEIYSNRMNK